MRSTHTYVEMELSQDAYDEIAKNMRETGYDHAFGKDGTIDMHGLAVTRSATVVDSNPIDLNALQKLRQNDSLAKTLNTVATVTGAPNPFVNKT